MGAIKKIVLENERTRENEIPNRLSILGIPPTLEILDAAIQWVGTVPYFYMKIAPWVYDDCPLPYLNVTVNATQYLLLFPSFYLLIF